MDFNENFRALYISVMEAALSVFFMLMFFSVG